MRIRSFAFLSLVGAAAAMLALPSCSTSTQNGSLSAYQSYDRPTKLPSDPANVRVKVSLSRQRVYVMEGSEMLLAMPVSVGAPSTPTPQGTFRIYSKQAKRRAVTHGYAYNGDQAKKCMISTRPSGWSFKGTPMPYWCEFKSAYGFHAGWIKHHPCTHGCIRMHENLAPKFYRLVSLGTPVSIAYSQPEDATHADMPLPPDAGPLPDYPTSIYVGEGYFSRHKTPSYQ